MPPKEKGKAAKKERKEKKREEETGPKNHKPRAIPPISSGHYPGRIRIWTTATIIAQAIDQSQFLEISELKWPDRWRGEGGSFPSKVG